MKRVVDGAEPREEANEAFDALQAGDIGRLVPDVVGVS
jgi:hypothetical protein